MELESRSKNLKRDFFEEIAVRYTVVLHECTCTCLTRAKSALTESQRNLCNIHVTASLLSKCLSP